MQELERLQQQSGRKTKLQEFKARHEQRAIDRSEQSISRRSTQGLLSAWENTDSEQCRRHETNLAPVRLDQININHASMSEKMCAYAESCVWMRIRHQDSA
eukprot:1136319-Pelagomonas_calceolata.AAC.2